MTIANDLVALAAPADYFMSLDDREFATFDVNGHRETWPVRSSTFKQWMAGLYFAQTGGAPNADALNTALNVLSAKARFGTLVPQAVHVRLARVDDTIYLDLGDPEWQAIAIRPDGWRLDATPPVRFRRPQGFGRLPVPVSNPRLVGPATGDPLAEFHEFVNADTETLILIVGWLIGALAPDIPFPVLVLFGEQGSAKSTLTRLLRSLIDPASTPLRYLPRDERDLAIAAATGWIASFDNVSGLRDWTSDAICRLATGGGIATRRLYTDDEEQMFDLKRPVILNGIDDIATRSDLLDRSIVVELPRISDEARRSEGELFATFDGARPRLLGILLNAVVTALKREGGIHLERPPRMADFATWVTSAEPALGWSDGTFVAAYRRNRASAHEITLDASPIVAPLRIVAAASDWTGTASELLARFEQLVDERTRKGRDWPANPRTLSSALRRLAPNLRSIGIVVEHSRVHAGRRMIDIRQVEGDAGDVPSNGPSVEATDEPDGKSGETASPASPPSPARTNDGYAGDAGDDGIATQEVEDDYPASAITPDGEPGEVPCGHRGCSVPIRRTRYGWGHIVHGAHGHEAHPARGAA